MAAAIADGTAYRLLFRTAFAAHVPHYGPARLIERNMEGRTSVDTVLKTKP